MKSRIQELAEKINMTYDEFIGEMRKRGCSEPTAAKIWRGGCIIRAEILEDIRQAFAAEPDLENLIASSVFRGRLKTLLPSVRAVVETATQNGIPLLALSSALHYFESLRAPRLPLNLVQAQRDYFGAHTYERLGGEGEVYHTEWGK